MSPLIKITFRKRFVSGLLADISVVDTVTMDRAFLSDLIGKMNRKEVIRPCVGSSAYIVDQIIKTENYHYA